MAYWTHTVKPIGQFTEKEVGNYFEYSVNDDIGKWWIGETQDVAEKFPHKVWVLDGYRYANVKKTVAYIVVDEDENGQPVTEKWHIKGCRQY